jgi:hypothetical protein
VFSEHGHGESVVCPPVIPNSNSLECLALVRVHSIRPFHDLTNESATSSWGCEPRASASRIGQSENQSIDLIVARRYKLPAFLSIPPSMKWVLPVT